MWHVHLIRNAILPRRGSARVRDWNGITCQFLMTGQPELPRLTGEDRGFVVRGLSLLHDSAGIRRFSFSLDARLSVLYGLNGAGKSRVLALLRAGLGGPEPTDPLC